MKVKEQLNSQLAALVPALEKFPWESKEHYAWFLAQTYYYVRHSTRLLAMASSRFDFDQNDQHYGFATHIAEETRHEMLAVNDLKALGFSIQDYPELPETRSWYHSQYYYVQNVDPAGLLGAVLALEGLSVFKGPWLHEKVCQHHGKAAGSFLKVHASEDLHHIEGACAGFDQLRAEQKPIALQSLEQSIWEYAAMLTGICERIQAKKIPLKPHAKAA
ncbi:MAG: iron-containing redox enzyme family protein [Bdellovibrionaceae bacterium]|nr:iron-containing redox enzyme family protein [Pseudobdellovibrionaceae bacterium]